jgi:hypothetical protein
VARAVAVAHERFVTGAETDGVRPIVLDSWRRSLRWGVDPDGKLPRSSSRTTSWITTGPPTRWRRSCRWSAGCWSQTKNLLVSYSASKLGFF